MKIAFRLECPHCNWGHEWRDDFVNQGWLQLSCKHCQKEFFTKISIPTINIEIQAEAPAAPIASIS